MCVINHELCVLSVCFTGHVLRITHSMYTYTRYYDVYSDNYTRYTTYLGPLAILFVITIFSGPSF